MRQSCFDNPERPARPHRLFRNWHTVSEPTVHVTLQMQQLAETRRLQNICGNVHAYAAAAVQHHIPVAMRNNFNKTGIKSIMGDVYGAWDVPPLVFSRVAHVQDEMCVVCFDALHQFCLRNSCDPGKTGIAPRQGKQSGVGKAAPYGFAEDANGITRQAFDANGNIRFFGINHSHPCHHKRARPEVLEGKTDMKKYPHNSRRELV